jgi:hypothetical protein
MIIYGHRISLIPETEKNGMRLYQEAEMEAMSWLDFAAKVPSTDFKIRLVETNIPHFYIWGWVIDTNRYVNNPVCIKPLIPSYTNTKDGQSNIVNHEGYKYMDSILKILPQQIKDMFKEQYPDVIIFEAKDELK